MKTKILLVKNYNTLFILLWAMILPLFLMQQNNCTNILVATFFISSIGIPGIITSYILSGYLLPRALRNKAMSQFILVFFVWVVIFSVTLAIASFFAQYLENNAGWDFGGASFTSDSVNESFVWEVFSSLPSSLVINFGFCGLRFYFEHAVLEKNHVEAQLQILQRQITPHFMFNVLNHINILMQRDIDLASSLLIKYSEILRYQLYEGSKERILLKDEVDFLKNYIEVEQMRWGSELDVRATWGIENENLSFAPLLLIPLVENAFKYVDRESVDGAYVSINFTQKGKDIYMEVENSCRIQVVSPHKSGIGLSNLEQRLDILYLNKYELKIDSGDDKYKIVLHIHV